MLKIRFPNTAISYEKYLQFVRSINERQSSVVPHLPWGQLHVWKTIKLDKVMRMYNFDMTTIQNNGNRILMWDRHKVDVREVRHILGVSCISLITYLDSNTFQNYNINDLINQCIVHNTIFNDSSNICRHLIGMNNEVRVRNVDFGIIKITDVEYDEYIDVHKSLASCNRVLYVSGAITEVNAPQILRRIDRRTMPVLWCPSIVEGVDLGVPVLTGIPTIVE